MIESYVNLILDSDKKDKLYTKTFYKVLSNNQNISLIQFEPKTGKKHQLRIVAKNLGSPIVGDSKYNLNNSNKSSVRLHIENLVLEINHSMFKSILFLNLNFCVA